MLRIAKNIKKLRNDQKLTQDGLAEKINVTRQAISSWETGRTQPDAQMLIKLSEVFSVPIEEIIYGEKRNTAIETGEKSYMSAATVVIAVLGCLLVAAGIGLIFTFGWQKLPFMLKAVCAFVPLLCGQGFAIYTMHKKADSIAFREGSSVIWGAGIVATIALVNSIFSVHLGFGNCLFIDTVLILPIMYFMNSISPLPFVLFGAFGWCVLYGYWRYRTFINITTILILLFILVFPLFKKEKLKEVPLAIAKWFSCVSLVFLSAVMGDLANGIVLLGLFGAFILLFVYGEKINFFSPSGFVGSIGSFAVAMCTTIFIKEEFWHFDDWSTDTKKAHIKVIISLAVGIVIIAFALIKFRGNIKDNKFRLFSTLGFSGIFMLYVVNIINEFFRFNNVNTVSYILAVIIFFLMGLFYILYGAKENKLFPINLGFLGMMALFVYLMISYGNDNILINGIVMLIMGIALLGVNLWVSKRKKAEIEVISK